MLLSSRGRLVIGATCFALAAVLGALAIFGSAPDHKVAKAAVSPAATRSTAYARVVTAARDIRRGERIVPGMLTTLGIAESAPASTFRHTADVNGAIALEDIRAGQMLVKSAVLVDRTARPGLSVLVPPGKRAVALRVNDEVAVGNFVRPDDRVDIELVIPADKLAKLRGQDVRKADQPESRILLQNIAVLSVGEALTVKQDNRAIRMQNLTVAVTPKEALLIALAKQIGSFYLALRHPSDESDVRTALTTPSDLLQPGSAPSRSRKDSGPASTKHRVIVLEGAKETYQTVR